jgi:hypothetical protein
MKIENAMFIILIFCLLICALFWRQLSQFNKLPTTPPSPPIQPPPPPTEDGIKRDIPTVELPGGRDVFKLPWQNGDKEPTPAPIVRPTLTLSTIIFWNSQSPLAIINGEILTKGDKDSKSQFRVDTITRDKVGIRFIDDGTYVWLTPGAER